MSLVRKVDIRDEDGNAFTNVNPLPVDLNTGTDNPIFTHTVGEVSADNSTSSPLAGGATFTGTSEDIKDESVIIVSVFADQASATNGLSVEFSTDDSNWDHTDVYTIPASTGKTFSFQPTARYFRVRYTNSGTVQTAFRLQTLLKSSYVKPSSHRVADEISNQDDAELAKAVLTGEDSTGNFHNVKTTQDGNLTITDNSDGLAIAEGNVTGKDYIHKFGFAPDFDFSDGKITLWEGANDSLLGGGAMNYTYSTTADIDTISSSDAGDTVDIEIQGLDANLDVVVQTVTLTGQTDVTLTTPLKRVFRLINTGSSSLVGVVYLRTNGSTQTSGVPDTANTVRALIDNGNNQTLMCVYTVPNGKTAYMRSWNASTAGANKTTNYTVSLWSRVSGGVFTIKDIKALSETGSSLFDKVYIEPQVFSSGSDIEIRAQIKASGVTGAAISGGFDLVLVDN